MKKIFALLILSLSALGASAQDIYWVFLTDKAGTTFDPYTYFDAKAIERYQQCGADLYDVSNYPLNDGYVAGINALATEEVGLSRWLNAMGIAATPEQIAQIEALPYVLRVQRIEVGDMVLAGFDKTTASEEFDEETTDGPLTDQLVRMQGQLFRDKGIDGRGIRIAVFDGGFPRVNTHDAFRHLRDEGRILKTWNFPNRKENVYGWNSHGTMTLSCIGGRFNGRDLGLATGAEYLLARTEVEAEPFKEEVWWMQAVEWADRNGANIISSSLGYGKERHYTRDMDGTSYVARAANLAARKGILVVNSAGNEADDKQWRTIITPSDADSALCVGGINHNLDFYSHISFSSYGPSADGRLKPNVCAFGHAATAATTSDHKMHYVDGTSFSCPLVAGFAACAWQASPGKTAMEMFHAIERSADLYPYYDYAFGYGVPQASAFTGNSNPKAPSFRFLETDDTLYVKPLRNLEHTDLFYHYRRPYDGQLDHYGQYHIYSVDTTQSFAFDKTAIFNRTLVVNLAGYTDSFSLSDEQWAKYDGASGFAFMPSESQGASVNYNMARNGARANRTSKWGSNATYSFDAAFMLGLPSTISDDEVHCRIWSPAKRVAFRLTAALSKAYRLGIGFEYGHTAFRYNSLHTNALEYNMGESRQLADNDNIVKRKTNFGELGIELFQRVRLTPGGLMGKGLHWDLGIYGSYGYLNYRIKEHLADGGLGSSTDNRLLNPSALSDYRWNYGVVTRFANDWYGLYARFRLNGIGQQPAAGKNLLPRLEVGLQLAL